MAVSIKHGKLEEINKGNTQKVTSKEPNLSGITLSQTLEIEGSEIILVIMDG